jgi:hypothetical protein
LVKKCLLVEAFFISILVITCCFLPSGRPGRC